MVSCNSCSSCPGCSTNVVVTYPGNNGCSQGNCNTGTYYPQQKNGCNQGNCNTQQQQNVIINVCNWQYQCYTKNVCNSCGNSNQYKVCQWKCTNYCQSYFCGWNALVTKYEWSIRNVEKWCCILEIKAAITLRDIIKVSQVYYLLRHLKKRLKRSAKRIIVKSADRYSDSAWLTE